MLGDIDPTDWPARIVNQLQWPCRNDDSLKRIEEKNYEEQKNDGQRDLVLTFQAKNTLDQLCGRILQSLRTVRYRALTHYVDSNQLLSGDDKLCWW